MSNPGEELTPVPARFEDPGLPEHKHRRSDSDPKVARKVSTQVAVLFMLSSVGAIGAIVAYFLVPPGETIAQTRLSNLLLGVGLFLTMFCIGVAAIHWAKALMEDKELIEERHDLDATPQQAAEGVAAFKAGVKGANIERRGVLKGAALGALALAPLPVAVPIIANLGGDWDVSKFRHTLWDRNVHLVTDPDGRRIKASDVTVGSIFHVIPEGLYDSEHWIEEKAKAVSIVLRLNPDDLTEAPEKKDWSYQGIVAYSKICTHVGCPVALYEQQTHHLLCPCHQSTFDMADGAKVIFGPAKRPLPQLPITVDDEGYLIAQSDFHEPIGPSYWEREK